ncbi:MAG: TonB-dependent receptor [Gammaproteobacteria bacterium]|jgi:vitamin B12 transporter|nr:TonB-dependent receptor [Gammaproteobacteria bacterium]MBT3858233.1 TonB-dependent receptor [Gammaproteobacteria bacterium]MBT3988673.1 TonB-dependent receptor [Gammaproteobacteria bacterium]MBT4255537.1 TonB-dependent receptor [Gammaproteobacteria bacterium]MBT4580629.1 TonB-dependent receptor [Gammaproteobacteria bacterium]
MKLIPYSSLLVSTCLSASIALAQNDAEEILVVANRIEQSSNSVMAATTVIDKDSIRRSFAQNLAELLAVVPGMQFSQSGGQGAQTSLFLRGTESDHTLVMIDGVQMSTSTGLAARLEFIPLDQIERIEIVRGPRSSVYGSEAIGGVLNIITQPQVEEDFSGTLNFLLGTESSSDRNLGLQGKVGNTTLSLSASHRETDGIDFRESGSPDDDGYENDSVAFSLTHQFDDRLSFSSSYSNFDANSDYDDGLVETNSEQLSATLSAVVSENWDMSLVAEKFEEDNVDAGSFGTTISNSENRKISLQNVYSIDQSNIFSFGIDHQEQALHYSTFGALQSNTSRDNDGVYGVFIHESEPLDFTLSLRNDDNERFGSHSTGSIALGRDFSDTLRAWVSYGTAFKAPNLIDLYVDFPSFFFFANPDLKPETSESLELSVQGQAWGAQWQVNVFRNDIEDLISTDASFTSLANIQKARIDGVEATVSTRIAQWQMNAALTVMDHENLSTGANLLRRPEQTLSLNVSREFGSLDLAVNFMTQNEHLDIDPLSFGASQVGGYGIISLIAGYQISEEFGLRLRIGNLTDKEYQIVDGFNTYGRTAQLSLNYRF